MTITFIPGEVNKSTGSVVQSNWKNHHVVIYGLGNNLIITSGTIQPTQRNPNPYNIDRSLQTIYLQKDPEAICFNSENGYIAIGYDSSCFIFKPMNEYMKIPKWVDALQFDIEIDSRITCLDWASEESELAVGTEKQLLLYHISDSFGELEASKRWEASQPNSIERLYITPNAKLILTTNSVYDRLVKIWNRVSYGDDSTLFEVSYLPHPQGTFVKQFHWRRNQKTEITQDKVLDSSMANIKRIRGLLNRGNYGNEDNEVIYTFTSNKVLNVWASFESSGHDTISNWANLDLSNIFQNEEEYINSFLVIEHQYLKSFTDYVKEEIENQKQGQEQEQKSKSKLLFKNADVNLNDYDLILVISSTGRVKIYAVSNISQSPPNNIKFTAINPDNYYDFKKSDFPSKTSLEYPSNLSVANIESKKFINHYVNPVLVKCLCKLNNDERINTLSFLVHDRAKNTLRFEAFNPTKILTSPLSKTFGVTLLNKYQGHVKSIRKLVRSYSSYTSKNVILSISNFPSHNYIWEPLVYNENDSSIMSITRRFRLDLGSQPVDGQRENAMWDAVIINDVERPNDYRRRHLVLVAEKSGNVSLWDCNGFDKHDQPVDRISILPALKKSPRAFAIAENNTNLNENVKQYVVVAVYEKDSILAWNILIRYAGDEIIDIRLEAQSITDLPQDEHIHQVTKVDSFLTQSHKSLIAVIDKEGLLKSYRLKFAQSKTQQTSGTLDWELTHTLFTNIKNADRISGSTVINKFAIINDNGYHLSIWDIDQNVLEYEEDYHQKPQSKGPVVDLDWTFVNATMKEKLTANAILSVGFPRSVWLYTQLRYDYTNKIPTYAAIKEIDISDYTSHQIGDLIWLDDGYLVIGCGNQFFIDDRWVKLGSGGVDSTIRQLMSGYITNRNDAKDQKQGIYSDGDEHYKNNKNNNSSSGGDGSGDGSGSCIHVSNGVTNSVFNDTSEAKDNDDMVYDISHLVRVLNGPLPVYHPQFLIQALFMGQTVTVQKILVSLFQALRHDDQVTWDLGIDFEKEVDNSAMSLLDKSNSHGVTTLRRRLSQNFNLDVFTHFTAELADLLVKKLMTVSLPLLTRHQQSTLISVTTIVKDLNKGAATLDENGMRFMMGFKLFQYSTKQKRMTMRDFNWALHSDSKEVLLSSVEEYYSNKLSWESVKKTGLVYWVKSERLVKVIEAVVRNEFSELKNPGGIVSLLYLALRKKQVLIGLWRIVQHEEKTKMLKFLSNDFTDKRWKSAALKNAFVLLGKHRYYDAAYFFLLGDEPIDCCNTIANKINDVQLAIAVAKVYSRTQERSSGGGGVGGGVGDGVGGGDVGKADCLVHIIEKYILPTAIENGDRWTSSWVFWQIHDKPLSIQALIKTPIEMVIENMSKFPNTSANEVTPKGLSFLQDDPVLIILFNDLRLRNINYLKGSSRLSPNEEFQFVIKVAMIYTRMGCDYLALLLLKHWTFSVPQANQQKQPLLPISEKQGGFESINFNGQAQDGINRDDFNQEWGNNNTNGIMQPSILDSYTNDQQYSVNNKKAPPAQAFEEPDMSSFSFGF